MVPRTGPIPPPRERKPRRERDDFDQRVAYDDEPVFQLDAGGDGDGDGDVPGFEPGTTVSHVALGTGRVVGPTGSGRDQKLIVEFDSIGRKTVQAKWLERR